MGRHALGQALLVGRVAASVARRHLVRGRAHSLATTRRLRGGPATPGSAAEPATGSALALLEQGHLTRALAVARGPLREYVAGELAVLTPMPGGGRDTVARPARTASPLRVLHLVTNSLPHTVAGYTIRTHGIVTAQRAHGVDAQVLTRLGYPVTKGHFRTEPTETVDGVPHHRLLAALPLRADKIRSLDAELTSRLVEQLRPSVLHAHSNHLNAQVAIEVGRRLGVPVVYEVRGFLEETWRSRGHHPDSDFYRLTREVETWCLEHADAVVTISHGMKAAITSRGIDPGKITVAPNAVGPALVDATPPPWRVARNELVVGVVGTLNDYEGVDTLLRAAAGVPGTHVLVVGDGPARVGLERLAREVGVPHTFTGRVAPHEVSRWYASLDVYAVPRRDLPVTRLVPPLKPVEAMALARPVIASDLPPLRELVRHGETGLLVPPGDVEALAQAIQDLADPAVRRRLGAAARRAVAAERTWTRVHHTLLETYLGLDGLDHRDEGARHVH